MSDRQTETRDTSVDILTGDETETVTRTDESGDVVDQGTVRESTDVLTGDTTTEIIFESGKKVDISEELDEEREEE